MGNGSARRLPVAAQAKHPARMGRERQSVRARTTDPFTPNGILHLIRAIRFDEPYVAAFVIKTVMEASGLEFTPGAHR
jgi:hypothetical protein